METIFREDDIVDFPKDFRDQLRIAYGNIPKGPYIVVMARSADEGEGQILHLAEQDGDVILYPVTHKPREFVSEYLELIVRKEEQEDE